MAGEPIKESAYQPKAQSCVYAITSGFTARRVNQRASQAGVRFSMRLHEVSTAGVASTVMGPMQ